MQIIYCYDTYSLALNILSLNNKSSGDGMNDREELLRLFYHILRKMQKKWSDQLRGVTYTQYLILRSLEHSGPQKAARLASVTQTTPGAVTSASDRLVAQGYARRAGDAQARRIVYLELTEQGRQLTLALIREQEQMMLRLFGGLEEEDIRQLIRIYRKLSENLD